MQNNYTKLVNVIACHSCTVSCTGNVYGKSHVIMFVLHAHLTGLWFLWSECGWAITACWEGWKGSL